MGKEELVQAVFIIFLQQRSTPWWRASSSGTEIKGTKIKLNGKFGG